MRKLKIIEHISLDGVIQVSGVDGAWLMTAAKRRAIDSLRRRRKGELSATQRLGAARPTLPGSPIRVHDPAPVATCLRSPFPIFWGD
jgi:hypothetical protein